METKILKSLAIFVMVLLPSSISIAQTFLWEMPPKEYTSISRVTQGIYQVVYDGKIGLIKPDGTKLSDVNCDEITSFYENKALLLKHDEGGKRIIGVITVNGRFILFSDKFYALQGQEFYSDGLLSVKDDQGRKGYIDENGNALIGFTGEYNIIKPFSEGYATVYKRKKYTLINKAGNEESIFIGIGEVSNGTNVYNGLAYIFDKLNNKWYTWDVKNKKHKSVQKPKDVQQFDYLNCFSTVTKRGKSVPSQVIPSGKLGLSPLALQGKYGFKKGNKLLLPFQFDSATTFEDNYSIVKLGSKIGILKYYETAEELHVKKVKNVYEYNVGKKVDCSFTVSTPSIWDTKNIEIVVKDSVTGNILETRKNGDSYFFSCNPQLNKQFFLVEARSEGLIIAYQPVSYEFKKRKQDLSFSIQLVNDEADNDGNVWVKIIITNPSEETINTTVTITGGTAKFSGKSEKITIQANKSVEMRACFMGVKKKYTNQYVKVSSADFGSALKNNISFKAAPPPIL